MKNAKLNNYEESIIGSLENNEWKTVAHFKQEIEKIEKYADYTLDNLLNINIQLNELDIIKLKKKSKDVGIHYKSLISALVHNFVTEKIRLTI